MKLQGRLIVSQARNEARKYYNANARVKAKLQALRDDPARLAELEQRALAAQMLRVQVCGLLLDGVGDGPHSTTIYHV